jgi:hypothetical protein
MGKISKRLLQPRIHTGYCMICGLYKRLSWEHVPPKCCTRPMPVEQKLVSEAMERQGEITAAKSTSGSKFKTICHKCNNEIIGTCDQEVATTIKLLNVELKNYYSSCSYVGSIISVPFNALKFARAMIGHILAASPSDDCLNPHNENDHYNNKLRSFVLGDDGALKESHNIYCWYYPYHYHLSARNIGFWNNGVISHISLLSFHPIAFLVTGESSTYPFHARKLELSHDRLHLDLSPVGFKYSQFPFHGLEGNQFYATHDAHNIVSFPIK